MAAEPECIERDCLLAGQLVATAFLESDHSACTLAWPAASDARLDDVLAHYFHQAPCTTHTDRENFKVQGWRGDDPFEFEVDRRNGPEAILQFVKSATTELSQPIDIMDISSPEGSLEILFGESNSHISRFALMLDAAPATRLMSFFSAFHRSPTIRGRYSNMHDTEASALMRNDALLMFSPLPMHDEREVRGLQVEDH